MKMYLKGKVIHFKQAEVFGFICLIRCYCITVKFILWWFVVCCYVVA